MARMKIQEPNKETLEELIPVYGEQNTQCNALKKVVADLNTKIKAAIHAEGRENTDIIINGWKCTLSVSEDTKVNEEMLLEILKSNKIPVIKTREYVDFDELEKLMYAGKVSKKVLLEMDKCNESVVKETLRCSRVKGE